MPNCLILMVHLVENIISQKKKQKKNIKQIIIFEKNKKINKKN